jgi:hypothetical protein
VLPRPLCYTAHLRPVIGTEPSALLLKEGAPKLCVCYELLSAQRSALVSERVAKSAAILMAIHHTVGMHHDQDHGLEGHGGDTVGPARFSFVHSIISNSRDRTILWSEESSLGMLR